jgi:kinesin family member 2/24
MNHQLDLLFEYLGEVELTHFYSQFKSKNLTIKAISTTPFTEICSTLGITEKQDRRKLLELIQIAKKSVIRSPETSRETEILENCQPLDYKLFKLEKENYRTTPTKYEQQEEEDEEFQEDDFMKEPEPVYKTPISSPVYSTPRQTKILNNSKTTTNSPMKTPLSKTPKSEIKTRKNLSKICVAVRKRPLNSMELKKGAQDIVPIKNEVSLTVCEPKQKLDLTKYTEGHVFMFDEVFTEMENNEELYRRTAQPLVQHVFNGGNATCFAYGQTGSGKTFTMMGKGKTEGIYLLASKDIFNMIDSSMFVSISFFEIYAGKLFDLLNEKQKLFAREDSSGTVNIVGLKEIQIQDVGQLMNYMECGNKIRSTGSTGVNAESSRSHAILQISVNSENGRIGKFSFIDLAGSERGADTKDNDKQTRMEGAEINKSLLALKECIRSLDQNKKHIPFRGSKLTEVLRDSFIGNSKTCMIANISPSSTCCEHTLNTLRYADRVKEFSKTGNEDDVLKARDKRNESIQIGTPIFSPKKDFAPLVDSFKVGSHSKDLEDEMYIEDSIDHELLIELIIQQEEEVVQFQQFKIQNNKDSLLDEMSILESFMNDKMKMKEYIHSTEQILEQQMHDLIEMRTRLEEFKKNVEKEEQVNAYLEK